ncbi:NAD(P)/FAD-dependent oxidoreductase [Hydrocarboniclastica marina]|uniref:NAD(P)/FAD-dependent oxidoreductase n=1 Tax=Hydrocarboniclastica marina TaxID=2259620 RepID=A0A4P7XFT6_9ALTE|nr:NAD(P)/FAD-dependent oxidoreductase [Hydrocarboniclastica marina]QCF25796.1 NAD(P)/FAD-dependent oxidoreductase [Hydrocarboniclastica marina]
MPHKTDVIVIGAGAAGLMAALTAGYRGRRVTVLDHANKAGKKILMSGGGRCNFTNLNSTPANFLSDNPAFCISALKRYSPWDFLELVERHGVAHEEKAAGQLFCQGSSRDILTMLMTECEWAGAEIRLKVAIDEVQPLNQGFRLKTSEGIYECASVIIASGGLSIPTLGASGFGYNLARQFGLNILPTRPGLVPFTLHPHDKARFETLAGLSCEVQARVAPPGPKTTFTEPMLFTHRGLSGPAMLQVSSYWQPGETVSLNLLPLQSVQEDLYGLRRASPQKTVAQYCADHLPRRFLQSLAVSHDLDRPLQDHTNEDIETVAGTLQQWLIKPAGTEGYRTAEVTLGGVDTTELSSRTMAARSIPGLFFIGEVVDVTGQLGGHNFQWAWASGVAAGQEA